MDAFQKNKLEKSSSIKKMQQSLYTKQNTISQDGRKILSHEEKLISQNWQDEDDASKQAPEKREPMVEKKMTVFTKILIGAFGFFFLSIMVMLAVFYFGQNTVVFDQVDIQVQGPTSIPGGESFGYDVIITNRNPVDIVLSDVFIEYPDGAYMPGTSGEIQTKDTQAIEELAPGDSTTLRFETIFFGEEGEQKSILIDYQYRVRDSSNIFFKKREYTLALETSPLSLQVDSPTQVTTGNDLTITLTVASNANRIVENLGVQIDYPFGFTYATSSVEAINDLQDIFALGTLGVGEEKQFTITGSLSGQDDETRAFNYQIGLVDELNQQLSTALQRAQSVVTIARPPIALESQVNNSTLSLNTIEAGDDIELKLFATNNTQNTIRGGEIVLELTGNGYIQNKVITSGFYNEREKTVTWDQTIISELAELTPGESIEVRATLSTPGTSSSAGRVTDLTTIVAYTFTGDTSDTNDIVENVQSKTSSTIRAATELSHKSAVLFSRGPFENVGNIQLETDEENQYTIVWEVSNSTSRAENVVTTATLPIYVEFIQAENKDGAFFEYDEQRKVLSWSVDSVQPGAGYGSDGIEGVFQVSVSPSRAQRGDRIDLTTDKRMTGSDTFTNKARIYPNLPDDNSDLLKNDPTYRPGVERVE